MCGIHGAFYIEQVFFSAIFRCDRSGGVLIENGKYTKPLKKGSSTKYRTQDFRGSHALWLA